MPVTPIWPNPLTPAHVREVLASLNQAVTEDLVSNEELEEAFTIDAVAAEAVTTGEVIVLNGSGEWELARADSDGDADAIALEDISLGATGTGAYGGFVEKTGWGLTAGTWYFLSGVTAGAIVSSVDLDTEGASAIIVGRAVSSSKFWVSIERGILL